MSTRRPNASVKSVRPLHNGFLRLNEYEIETDTHAGGTVTVTRLVMERGHAVAVLGYDPARDEMVLVNELRPGMLAEGEYPFADALVAGGIGPHETAVEAARREMKEEANLDLRDPVVVHPGLYVSSGGTSEKIAIVVGFVDSAGAGGVHGNPGELEDIKTVVLTADEFIDRARHGAITDMKTALAGYWFAEHRDRLRASAGVGRHTRPDSRP